MAEGPSLGPSGLSWMSPQRHLPWPSHPRWLCHFCSQIFWFQAPFHSYYTVKGHPPGHLGTAQSQLAPHFIHSTSPDDQNACENMLNITNCHKTANQNYSELSPHTGQNGGGGLVTESCPTLAAPWTGACQTPLSMGFSKQEYWSGLPFPSPGTGHNGHRLKICKQ